MNKLKNISEIVKEEKRETINDFEVLSFVNNNKGTFDDKNNNITCPEKVKIKGQVYKFTGRIDWSKHYPIPVYKKDE